MMADFRKVSPGQPLSKAPSRSASWLNAVSAAAQAFQETNGPGGSKSIRSQQNPVEVKVKNMTGGDLLRGHAVLLDESLLDEVNHRKPFISGVTPADGKTRPLALLKSACKSEKFTEAFVSGVAPAIVNVASVDDTHASVQDGSNILLSSTSGQVEILTPPTVTGEQELLVLLGSGGGGTSSAAVGAVAICVNSIPPATLTSTQATPGKAVVSIIDWNSAKTSMVLIPNPRDGSNPWIVDALNFSRTDIRASNEQPIVLTGWLYQIDIGTEGQPIIQEWFVVCNVMDFRALPGFAVGDAPTTEDDPDLQIPYHSGGAADFKLDSRDCAEESP